MRFRNIYVNWSTRPTNVVQLSTDSESTVIGIWKQRKNLWYIAKPESKKNVIDVLKPQQFDEAIQNKKYSLRW